MSRPRGWVVVPRVMVLLQPVESRVPTKCVPEELKHSVIPERCGRDKGW